MYWEMDPRIMVLLSLISIQISIVAASTNSADGEFALNNLRLSMKTEEFLAWNFSVLCFFGFRLELVERSGKEDKIFKTCIPLFGY